MGRLTPDEASVHPRRHQLTRALGVDEMVDIDVMSLNVLPGDRVLLCSDGLSNEVSNELLAHLASPPISLEDSVEQLVAAARGAGGRDNISVVLLEFDEVTPATTPIRKTIGSTPPPVAQSARTPTIRSSRRPRRLTWRVWAGVFVCALVAGGFVMVMHWYAYSTYYLANDAGKIAVYQGQPHGVLWFKPVKVVDTTNLVAQLRPADRTALAATIGEPTLESALKYANALHNSWLLGQPVMSISSTTTTTKG